MNTCYEYETQRLAALYKLNLLDTDPEAAFDRIVQLAAMLFNLPIAAISLTDVERQWFKSRVGVQHNTLPRMQAPCAEVTNTADFLVIEDLAQSLDYHNSPLAESGVRFYAGAPLMTNNGFCLGAMCVLGYEPRTLTERERTSLNDLAKLVMTQIELTHTIGRIDSISGLPNRQQFVEDFRERSSHRAGNEAIASATSDASSQYLVYLSLGLPEQLASLTRFNSATFMDDLIREGAETIQSVIGPTRKVYQINSTNFAFFAPGNVEQESYVNLLRTALARYRERAASRFVTTASIGLAAFVPGVTDCYEVLRMSDFAAREAASVEGKVCLYSLHQDDAYRRRYQLMEDFGGALEADNQLRLVYQPRIDLRTNACTGAEALIRWRHPRLGEISPADFISGIEETPMRKQMTEWVCRTAIEHIARCRARGIYLTVSVNIVAANLIETDFQNRILAKLERFGVPPQCLELEVTEGSVVSNGSPAHEVLRSLARAGITIAIDDFGTGYSSLAYLKNLPAQIVKIDQTFLRNLDDTPKNKILLATMIKMARDLGFRTVAEGVETAEMWDFVDTCGCDEVQGYWISRPMEVDAFYTWCNESGFRIGMHDALLFTQSGLPVLNSVANYVALE